MADTEAPFRTWNGVEAWRFVDGAPLPAIGGEQILLCRVTYEPGKQVPDHAHEHTEQVMAIVDGEASVTVAGETHDVKAGDAVVINRGVRHSVFSEKGLTLLEALAPLPLGHVPDRDHDLV